MAGQDTAGCGEQDPVPPAERRAASAPREHLHLMSKDEQFRFPFQIGST
jgi:hypothetical protein